MRHKDPELMNRIREFAEDYYLTEGHSPSTTEIGEAVGIARGTAYKYLVAMDEQGMISYDGAEIRTEKIERFTATRGAVVYSPLVASCISRMIRMASRKRPLRSPARPRRLPDATLRS